MIGFLFKTFIEKPREIASAYPHRYTTVRPAI